MPLAGNAPAPQGNFPRMGMLLCCAATAFFPLSVSGQDKKPAGKSPPRVLLARPLGVRPAATTRLTLRGLHLDTASEVRLLQVPNAPVKIISKQKAPPPDKLTPQQVGDTQLVVEVTLPAGVGGPQVSLVVRTAAGETPPHSLLLETQLPLLAEKEPNDGFRTAQMLSVPVIVEGAIQQPRDVDVFAFVGRAGQRVVCEVLAARQGSPLDSLLTLYDAEGHELASNDDTPDSLDSHLEVVLPRDGTYYLSLQDAHDQGSPLHVYRLVVRWAITSGK